jgi:2-oxoglutarate ferredoxin oxidoreductase subunit beta
VRPASVPSTDDAARAARRLMTDDGMNIGVLYKGERKPYQPPVGKGKKRPSDLEAEFAL